MKTLPAVALSTVLAIASVAGAIALLDLTLPPAVVRTQVARTTSLQSGDGRVHYIVPLTAGDVAYCEVDRERMRALRVGMAIEVSRSLPLDRCVEVEAVGVARPAREP